MGISTSVYVTLVVEVLSILLLIGWALTANRRENEGEG